MIGRRGSGVLRLCRQAVKLMPSVLAYGVVLAAGRVYAARFLHGMKYLSENLHGFQLDTTERARFGLGTFAGHSGDVADNVSSG